MEAPRLQLGRFDVRIFFRSPSALVLTLALLIRSLQELILLIGLLLGSAMVARQIIDGEVSVSQFVG